MNPYKGTKENPHHVSVGVVLINDKDDESKILEDVKKFYLK
ncbi:MAG: hypothetical protein WCG97_03285 [bacterium]